MIGPNPSREPSGVPASAKFSQVSRNLWLLRSPDQREKASLEGSADRSRLTYSRNDPGVSITHRLCYVNP